MQLQALNHQHSGIVHWKEKEKKTFMINLHSSFYFRTIGHWAVLLKNIGGWLNLVLCFSLFKNEWTHQNTCHAVLCCKWVACIIINVRWNWQRTFLHQSNLSLSIYPVSPGGIKSPFFNSVFGLKGFFCVASAIYFREIMNVMYEICEITAKNIVNLGRY